MQFSSTLSHGDILSLARSMSEAFGYNRSRMSSIAQMLQSGHDPGVKMGVWGRLKIGHMRGFRFICQKYRDGDLLCNGILPNVLYTKGSSNDQEAFESRPYDFVGFPKFTGTHLDNAFVLGMLYDLSVALAPLHKGETISSFSWLAILNLLDCSEDTIKLLDKNGMVTGLSKTSSPKISFQAIRRKSERLVAFKALLKSSLK